MIWPEVQPTSTASGYGFGGRLMMYAYGNKGYLGNFHNFYNSEMPLRGFWLNSPRNRRRLARIKSMR